VLLKLDAAVVDDIRAQRERENVCKEFNECMRQR
jgi:hypothetical protein